MSGRYRACFVVRQLHYSPANARGLSGLTLELPKARQGANAHFLNITMLILSIFLALCGLGSLEGAMPSGLLQGMARSWLYSRLSIHATNRVKMSLVLSVDACSELFEVRKAGSVLGVHVTVGASKAVP
jgi:hypothetical protein